MKQFKLFNNRSNTDDVKKYTSKIKAPIYEPKNTKPHTLELCDTTKMYRLIQKINAANITKEEKKFLKFAAQRHNVFNYSKIADYYAHSSEEMQQLMEHSALVIIDFEKAIQYGYAKLSEQMTQQYLNEQDEE
tara:strand:+ start:28 stop:426 length:399 start_codon:yes stop_codon:yes gene_type:complete